MNTDKNLWIKKNLGNSFTFCLTLKKVISKKKCSMANLKL